MYKNWNLNVVEGEIPVYVVTSKSSNFSANDAELIQIFQDVQKKFANSLAQDFVVDINLFESPDYRFELKARVLPTPKKYKRIFTSGCFDLFHYGHLNILQRSKELCDELIVGVSTDELIERDKGIRPVIPYDERAKIISAIKYVDRVVPQTHKNKQAMVDEYQIDAITVGDDWKGRYPKVSCDMVYFSYTASVSSTILKDTLSLLSKKKV